MYYIHLHAMYYIHLYATYCILYAIKYVLYALGGFVGIVFAQNTCKEEYRLATISFQERVQQTMTG